MRVAPRREGGDGEQEIGGLRRIGIRALTPVLAGYAVNALMFFAGYGRDARSGATRTLPRVSPPA